MKTILLWLPLVMLAACSNKMQQTQKKELIMSEKMPIADGKNIPYNQLTPQEERVIVNKETEYPFTGEYDTLFKAGTYVCRRCNTPLYRSKDKFNSGCGWPAFDDEIQGAVKHVPDADGMRTEIICNNCGAH